VTAADNAELFYLFCEVQAEYDVHVTRCATCLRDGPGCCPHVTEGMGVYVDYHLRLVRFRRAELLRAFEAQVGAQITERDPIVNALAAGRTAAAEVEHAA
jgi:hypothetical protein